MSYWGNVHRRALRETLEMVKLDQPSRAALTLGLVAVPVLITWLAAHDASAGIRGAATVGALLLCTLAVYGMKLLAIPPILAAEADAIRDRLEKDLASFVAPEDDEEMRKGVAYALTGNWEQSLWENSGGRLTEVGEIAEQIRKLAARGRINVWGQVGPGEVHRIVPKEFWVDCRIDFLTLTAGQTAPVRSEKSNRHNPTRWNNLRINRAEFEREWPSPHSRGA